MLKEGVVTYCVSTIPSFARIRNLPNIKQEISTASFYSHFNLNKASIKPEISLLCIVLFIRYIKKVSDKCYGR